MVWRFLFEEVSCFSNILLIVSQVLYLEHTVEGLNRGRPWKMGSLQKGRSTWRILRDEETVAYGGSNRRKLYGCMVTLFDWQTNEPIGVSWSNTCGPNKEGGLEQRLLSWSQVSMSKFVNQRGPSLF